jgi:hypothetical protein
LASIAAATGGSSPGELEMTRDEFHNGDIARRADHVGLLRPTNSWHVRCTSDSSRISALQRFDESATCGLLHRIKIVDNERANLCAWPAFPTRLDRASFAPG